MGCVCLVGCHISHTMRRERERARERERERAGVLAFKRGGQLLHSRRTSVSLPRFTWPSILLFFGLLSLALVRCRLLMPLAPRVLVSLVCCVHRVSRRSSL